MTSSSVHKINPERLERGTEAYGVPVRTLRALNLSLSTKAVEDRLENSVEIEQNF